MKTVAGENRSRGGNADDAMSDYARGDDKAFAIVYDAVAPRLEGYLRRHLREPSLVEDIIQQTFMQMHDKRGTFAIGAQVVPWAFSIARNFMIDTLRKSKREAPADLSGEGSPVGALLVTAVENAEQVVLARETTQQMLSVFNRLTEHQRTAFELTEGDGLLQVEAAQILGTTVMGVKQCRHKVYQKLRAVLDRSKDDDPSGPPLARATAARLGGT
jgi:RNA polymerase sigma-70 factor (ECF subfamily)